MHISTVYANGDYICRTHVNRVTQSCNCVWGDWQSNGKRYCTGTRVATETVVTQWGNTRIGCPSGPQSYGYTDGQFRYGDVTSSNQANQSCQIEETDLNPPFIVKNNITGIGGITLRKNKKAEFDLSFEDNESGVKNARVIIYDPDGLQVLSRFAEIYNKSGKTWAGIISSASLTLNWRPLINGNYTLSWLADDYAGNRGSGSFIFYVGDQGSVCGNGELESGEQCDDGAENNSSNSRCDENCLFKACDHNDWSPLISEVCSGKHLIQSNSCDELRSSIGTGAGDCAAPETTANPKGQLAWSGGLVDLMCSDEGDGCERTWYSITDVTSMPSSYQEYLTSIYISGNKKLWFYSVDKSGNKEVPKSEFYGQKSNIQIIGSLKISQEIQSMNIQKRSIGDVNLTEAKNAIYRSTAVLVDAALTCQEDRVINTWSDIPSECLRSDGNVAYFEGGDIVLAFSDQLPFGGHTIVVRDGNLHIKNNLIYPSDNNNAFGMIVLGHSPNSGNVYLYDSVTNIVGALYADGSLFSVLEDDGDVKGYIWGSLLERAQILKNQLYWIGNIVTQFNTLGGSETDPLQCPVGIICDHEMAARYDIAYLRYFNQVAGERAKSPQPPNGAENNYSVIMKYSSTQPPLFSSVFGGQFSELGY